ncbi:glycosyltransferase family 4 protein [Desulfobulbus elongatus]|uniref:glycosyltransferase family 4 protein n=1 Tax=Desulfobulbus elongatus TaxID=53332 RepID=UPI000A01FCE4|nr:glycosyltransferase family 4 protein [Desulfobulbus elongatus]
MKILLITWGCDRDDVSEPQIAYRWVREIAKRHEVVVFSVSLPERFGCVKEQFPDLEVIEWRDIRVPPLLKRFRSLAKPLYFAYFRKARGFLRELVKQHRFDIIHHLNPFAWRYPSPAYGLGVPLVRGPVAGGLLTPVAMRSEIRDVFHPYKFLRLTDSWRKKLDLILRTSYQHTDCVLAAAPYVVDLLTPLPIRRVEIEIEHGLETLSKCQHQPQLHVNHEKIRLLFVGRIIRTKGVRDAIRALTFMKTREKVALTIIGDGEDMPACRQLVHDLHLEKIVQFRGWCAREDVENAYFNTDIFLFPSFREPTGGVILEAMTHGLPCVVCDYGGPSYMVTNKCGVLISPDAPEKYAKKIAVRLDELVCNKQLRINLGKNALIQAYSNFSWNEKMNRVDNYYRSLIK